MSLFQKSVLKKYLQGLDQDNLQRAWLLFQAHFQNPVIQENIRNAKEEEYQEGFVRDFFVNILGYTLKPQPNYNFVLEKKTETDATKSDGAMLRGENIIGVIELKDTGTTELDKIEKQVFGYKHKHKNCVYIITSNFEKIRFYINDSTEYEEFNLFTLAQDRFAILFLCLQQQSIENDLPLKLKQDSESEEENITKKLYADYSFFKKQIFNNIANQNPQFNKLELLKKTQKLLDRFLFILFAEDRLLLPPNSVREIIRQWEQLRELDNYTPLYDRFKKYFGYLNTGHEGKQYEIFAYNGGLFAPDEILDNIKVDDQILYDGSKTLSHYDYESEVDVNILGHIFEHSLGEIEEVQAELEGKAIDKTKTRRKKDGVFYTPRYITKYIVENTLGELCANKKAELKINEEIFTVRKRKDKKREKLVSIIDDYRHWLLTLTICDPACGSGAFLNQALEFLIAEHRYVDELKANFLGDALVLSDHENEILQNNLFGVDINEEAVEIARLSLWLRTARKGRKLSNLINNIKCGNSLIDDSSIVGEKAFNWQNEFEPVFANGGFDVVIGNPPYVDIKGLPSEIVDYIFKTYKTANNRINLFSIFIDKASVILKEEGKFSFIIPSSLLTQESYKSIREKLLLKTNINNIVRLPNESFGGGAGEVKVDTIILTFTLTEILKRPVDVLVYKGFDRINEITALNADFHLLLEQSLWQNDENFIFRINVNNSISDLISKIETDTIKLVKCADFCLGLTPYDKYKGHTVEQIDSRVFHAAYKKDETYKKLLAGSDVMRYFIDWNGEEWISYGNWLGASREQRFFTEKRILVKQIIDWSAKKIWAGITEEELYNTQNAFNLIAKEGYLTEYLLALINSSLMSFFHRKKFLEEYKDRFQKILIKDCKEFPIKQIPSDGQLPFVAKVDTIVSKSKELNNSKHQLLQLLLDKYEGLKLTNKLQDWPSLPFKAFLKELDKQKIKLSLTDQAEWMQYFETEKGKANVIQNALKSIDKEIDALVYELYNLTDDDIKIIEGNV